MLGRDFLESGDVDLAGSTRVGLYFGEISFRQFGRQRIGKAYRPGCMERFPMTPRAERRMKVVQNRHEPTPGGGAFLPSGRVANLTQFTGTYLH